MLRLITTLIAIAVLLLAGSTAALAQAGDPVAGCPVGFELMHADHDHEQHEHHHIGSDADQNGDGWICGSHVGIDEGYHVHFDNRVPLP